MNFARKLFACLSCVIFLCPATLVYGEIVQDNFFDQSTSHFDFLFTTFITPQNTGNNYEVIVFTKSYYKDLKFKKFESVYRANLELFIEISGLGNEKAEKKWTETIQVRSNDETQNENIYHITRSRFMIESGKFAISVSAKDINSGFGRKKEKKINTDLALNSLGRTSEILLIDGYEVKDNQISYYTPVVSDTLRDSSMPYYAYLELAPGIAGTKIDVSAYLESQPDNRKDPVAVSQFTVSNSREGQKFAFNISKNNLKMGNYVVRFIIDDNSGTRKEIKKEFFVDWFGLPSTDIEMNRFFEQITFMYSRTVFLKNFIRSTKEFKKSVAGIENSFKPLEGVLYKNLSYDRKVTLLSDVWSNLENPQDREILEGIRKGITRRIDFSIKNFSRGPVPGWKSDFGAMYMAFGGPESTKQTIYAGLTRNIYWYYNKIGIIFRFVDKYGYNEFELVQVLPIDAYIR